MAIRPTEKEKALGREFGWDGHALETGYEIMSFCDCSLPNGACPLDVEAVMDMGTFERYYEENRDNLPEDIAIDDMAALQALEDGYCKIVPIDELPEKLPEKYKFFGWVDTPENRKILEKVAEEMYEAKKFL